MFSHSLRNIPQRTFVYHNHLKNSIALSCWFKLSTWNLGCSSTRLTPLSCAFEQLRVTNTNSSPLILQTRAASIDHKFERTQAAKLDELNKGASALGENEGQTEEDAPLTRISYAGRPYKPSDLQTSKEYLQSEAYVSVYGNKPVWFHFRRNFKGHFHPLRPRPRCAHKGKLITGNPCPVCRDEHLLLHHDHMELLTQFIDPKSGEPMSHKVTGLCEKQNDTLIREIEMARDMGILEVPVAFRYYDYRQYYSRVELAPLVHKLPEIVYRPTIPHAETIEKVDVKPVIEKPRIPNRHAMEEMNKKVGVKLSKRRAIEVAAFKRGQREQYPKMKAALKRERESRLRMSQS